MPKTTSNECVIHEWVTQLTFQQQALLMTAMRGPDGLPKECTGKIIVRFLRGVVLKPAGDWSGENNNDFMWGNYYDWKHFVNDFWSDHDHYPNHFLMHLLHSCQVVAYKHPSPFYRENYMRFYLKGCKSFHMMPETEIQMDDRLNDFK